MITAVDNKGQDCKNYAKVLEDPESCAGVFDMHEAGIVRKPKLRTIDFPISKVLMDPCFCDLIQ